MKSFGNALPFLILGAFFLGIILFVGQGNIEAALICGLIMLPATFLGIVIGGTIVRNEKRAEELNTISRMTAKGFHKTVESNGLLIDQENKKWCVIKNSDEIPYIHDFSDLVDFKVVENGVEYRTNGGAARAVVGGALFGVLGAAAGAATAKKERSLDSIQVVVVTSNFEHPTETILISGPVGDTSSSYYRSCVDATNRVIGLLTAIKANA